MPVLKLFVFLMMLPWGSAFAQTSPVVEEFMKKYQAQLAARSSGYESGFTLEYEKERLQKALNAYLKLNPLANENEIRIVPIELRKRVVSGYLSEVIQNYEMDANHEMSIRFGFEYKDIGADSKIGNETKETHFKNFGELKQGIREYFYSAKARGYEIKKFTISEGLLTDEYGVSRFEFNRFMELEILFDPKNIVYYPGDELTADSAGKVYYKGESEKLPLVQSEYEYHYYIILFGDTKNAAIPYGPAPADPFAKANAQGAK